MLHKTFLVIEKCCRITSKTINAICSRWRPIGVINASATPSHKNNGHSPLVIFSSDAAEQILMKIS